MPDAIADLAARQGRPFVVEFPAPLPEHAMRLMATLGVEVRVRAALKDPIARAVPAHMATLGEIRFSGPAKPLRGGPPCAKCAADERGVDRCRQDGFCWRAQRAQRLLERRAKEREKEDTMGSGLEALERMDAGEPPLVDREPRLPLAYNELPDSF